MSGLLAMGTIFCMLYSTDQTMDIAAVVGYKGVNITFTQDFIFSFYTCLCNPAKNPCTVLSGPTKENISPVAIASSTTKDSLSSIPKCQIYPKLGDAYFSYVINCTKSVKSTANLNIRLLGEQSLNTNCPEDHVKVDWPSGIKIMANPSFVSVVHEDQQSGTNGVTDSLQFSVNYINNVLVVLCLILLCVMNHAV